MTSACKWCGKSIRPGREGFFGATAQDDGALWYCADDPSDERRHQPQAGPEDFLSGPRKAVAAHLVTEHGFDPVQADSILGQIRPGQTVAIKNLRIHRAGKSGQYGVEIV